MSRRIDIELTSARPDGTWTWRAAGAKEPKGVVEGSLLPEAAKTGDVLRADADFAIDGIAILAVLPPKEKKREEPERLEILGSGRTDGPGVTTQLVGRRGRGPGGDDRPRRDRPRRTDGPRTDGPRPDGDRRRPRRDDAPAGEAAGARRDGQRPRRDGAERREGGRRPAEAPTGERRPGGSDRGQAGRPAARPRTKRLTPANTHRTAVLESLAPEERAIAEQVLRGGVPAVRTALHLEREKATAEGRPAPDSDALLTMAERLLPRLRSAEWRDRAEAASSSLDDIGLRDLRAVVTGADLARDDESRALASTLREALEAKLTTMREGWFEEIRGHLAAGRTIRAVRLSGRPPEPSSRLPADLLDELTQHAGRTLGPSTSPDAWLAMLEAVAASPVRRNVKPEGLPEQATPELQRAAQQQAGRIPALAALLGLAIPPPPGPRRPVGAPGRPPRPAPPGAGLAPPPAPPEPAPAEPSPAGPSPAPLSKAPEAVPAPEGVPAPEAIAAPDAVVEPVEPVEEQAPEAPEVSDGPAEAAVEPAPPAPAEAEAAADGDGAPADEGQPSTLF